MAPPSSSLVGFTAATVFIAAAFLAAPSRAQVEPRLLAGFRYVNFTFQDAASAQEYIDNKYYENVMPAGVKVGPTGDVFVSFPRWKPNVPATLAVLDFSASPPIARPFPTWAANEVGVPEALQNVLGFEIDPCNRVWALDQGKVNNSAAIPGSIKLVVYNGTTGDELFR